MGSAVWLFGWLIHRQTTQRNGSGLVLRGKPLTYAAISEDTGWPPRTIRKWMAKLRETGYVDVKHSCYSHLVIRVLNAKKFGSRQLDFPQFPHYSQRPEWDEMASQVGRPKEGIKIEHKKTEGRARDAGCGNVENLPNLPSGKGQSRRLGMTAVEREVLVGSGPVPRARNDQDPGKSPAATVTPSTAPRAGWWCRRATRDDLVRRELQVGTGPEVKRQR